MKKAALLIVSVLFLYSCELEDTFPRIENITSGKKWTLHIGSSPKEVYDQLQELGIEKDFDDVGIVYRKPFSKPDEIKSDIGLYQAITLETTSGVTKRILIQFKEERVSFIAKGGGLLEPIAIWPADASEEVTIKINDPVDGILEKLSLIYRIPEYKKYQIILPNKWLKKPYDLIMGNYNEWAFAFSEDITSGKVGRYSVRLYFKNKKLVKIRQKYTENEIVY